MVPDLAGIYGSSCLWNQLGSPHRLSVPVCGAIERDFSTSDAARVGRVLICGIEVDVGCYIGWAVLTC